MVKARLVTQTKADDINTCPRCGQHGYIEKMRRGSNIYILYVHEKTVNGKRTRKRCYVGAERYIYVNKFNDIGLTGIHDRTRYKKYLAVLLSRLTEEERVSLIGSLFKDMSNDSLEVLAKKLVAVIDSRESSSHSSKEEGLIDTTVREVRRRKINRKRKDQST